MVTILPCLGAARKQCHQARRVQVAAREDLRGRRTIAVSDKQKEESRAAGGELQIIDPIHNRCDQMMALWQSSRRCGGAFVVIFQSDTNERHNGACRAI